MVRMFEDRNKNLINIGKQEVAKLGWGGYDNREGNVILRRHITRIWHATLYVFEGESGETLALRCCGTLTSIFINFLFIYCVLLTWASLPSAHGPSPLFLSVAFTLPFRPKLICLNFGPPSLFFILHYFLLNFFCSYNFAQSLIWYYIKNFKNYKGSFVHF